MFKLQKQKTQLSENLDDFHFGNKQGQNLLHFYYSEEKKAYYSHYYYPIEKNDHYEENLLENRLACEKVYNKDGLLISNIYFSKTSDNKNRLELKRERYEFSNNLLTKYSVIDPWNSEKEIFSPKRKNTVKTKIAFLKKMNEKILSYFPTKKEVLEFHQENAKSITNILPNPDDFKQTIDHINREVGYAYDLKKSHDDLFYTPKYNHLRIV